MSREDTLVLWSQGPGQTEATKCENAERGVKGALADSSHLRGFQYRVFTQGSFRARTNVRLNSDVDICVCQLDQFSFDLPADLRTAADYGINTVPSTYSHFKSAVGSALVDRFGAASVQRGNKAWDVHANSYRVDADVVAAQSFHHYIEPHRYHPGIAFWTDNGERIVNWPEQSYQNGVTKNDETQRVYKRVVRILKRCRDVLQDEGVLEACDIGSFLIESLVWNVPSRGFYAPTYSSVMEIALGYLIGQTAGDETCSGWVEVNGLKYLFHQSQPWTRAQANAFLRVAYDQIAGL